MFSTSFRIPDGMPTLSPGKHRNPRRGACFMEFASYLAGEKWSDHPACTHAALAGLARMTNDVVSDATRARMVPLIPRAVGLTSDDPQVTIRIVSRAACAALPIASHERQRPLAVGLVACLSLTDDREVRASIRAALDQAPDCEAWARAFVGLDDILRKGMLTDQGRDAILRLSVVGIAQACVPNPNERLLALLEATIEDCERTCRVEDAPAVEFAWERA
jgi:hypothetical protein